MMRSATGSERIAPFGLLCLGYSVLVDFTLIHDRKPLPTVSTGGRGNSLFKAVGSHILEHVTLNLKQATCSSYM